MDNFSIIIKKYDKENEHFVLKLTSTAREESIGYSVWKTHKPELYEELTSIFLASSKNENIEIPASILMLTGKIMTL
jgi:hypothetical protein